MSTSTAHYTRSSDEYAIVKDVHHPLLRAEGFTNILPGEVVLFDQGQLGQVLAFDTEGMDIMVFSTKPVRPGSEIGRTKKMVSFPIHQNMLGNMYTPLGEIIAPTHGSIPKDAIFTPIIVSPPPLPQRALITKQFETGFSLTDLMLPLGHGQRELLAGDRKSGKSAFVRRVAATQARLGTKVVYALIGKKTADIKQTYQYLEKSGVIQHSVIIATTAQDAVSTISLTPFAAMTVAEALRDQGNDVVVILDELSTHAEFYRELSLLAQRFPGRDSYPGDIFYVHAQLLERAGCFIHPHDKEQSVSITCLPVARTTNSDVTDYITSNLISITDGHLLFETKLLTQGQQPAINTAMSVTRVGKQTQTPLLRDINHVLTSFTSQYKKAKGLTHLASEVSGETQDMLKKGAILLDFFSEIDDVSLPSAVQQIMVAMVWLGWFNQTHRSELHAARFKLNQRYQQDEQSKELLNSLVTQSDRFNDFIATVNQQKQTLLQLCQT